MVEIEFKTQVPVSLQSELFTAIQFSSQRLDVKDTVSPLLASAAAAAKSLQSLPNLCLGITGI